MSNLSFDSNQSLPTNDEWYMSRYKWKNNSLVTECQQANGKKEITRTHDLPCEQRDPKCWKCPSWDRAQQGLPRAVAQRDEMAADRSQGRKEQGRKELREQARQQMERERMAQPGPGPAGAGRPGMDTQSALARPGHSVFATCSVLLDPAVTAGAGAWTVDRHLRNPPLGSPNPLLQPLWDEGGNPKIEKGRKTPLPEQRPNSTRSKRHVAKQVPVRENFKNTHDSTPETHTQCIRLYRLTDTVKIVGHR